MIPDCSERGSSTVICVAAERDHERIDAAGEPLVVLEGDPRCCGRLGFVHSVPHGIEIALPERAPAEAAQVALLSAHRDDDPALRGRIEHPGYVPVD